MFVRENIYVSVHRYKLYTLAGIYIYTYTCSLKETIGQAEEMHYFPARQVELLEAKSFHPQRSTPPSKPPK
jgi:hypothetical protein